MSKPARMAIFAATSVSSVADVGGQILLMLTILGAIYFWLAIPVLVAMAGLLLLLIVSSRQITRAYPGGSSIYIVVRDNFGEAEAQATGAVLLIDYTLCLAVGIAAAVDQCASVFPSLLAYKVLLSLFLILLITYVNLRGVKASGTILAAPTYFFITTMLILIGVGFWQAFTGNLRVVGIVPSSHRQGFPYAGFVFAFLLLRTLTSGTTALPGIEVSNDSITAFTIPRAKNGATTLGWDAALLLLMFLGLSVLGDWVQAQSSAAEVLLAQVARAVYRDDLLQFLTLASATVILILVANTSIADFLCLATLQAGDGFLPQLFTFRGSRPVFRWGTIILAVSAGLLIIFFQGSVSRLLPLYIINVFLCLTLAQIGMAKRWRYIGTLMQTGALTPASEIITLGSILHYDRLWHFKLLLNGLSAGITGLVTVSFLVTKFTSGAWVIALLIPALSWMLMRIHRHYKEVTQILRTAAEHIS